MTREEIIQIAESVSFNLVNRSDESTLVEFAELVAQRTLEEVAQGIGESRWEEDVGGPLCCNAAQEEWLNNVLTLLHNAKEKI